MEFSSILSQCVNIDVNCHLALIVLTQCVLMRQLIKHVGTT